MRPAVRIRPARRGLVSFTAAGVSCLLVLTMADDLLAHELLVPTLPAPFQAAVSAGPYNFEFTTNYAIRLSVANSLSGCRVSLHYRLAGRDGEIKNTAQPFAPTADRAVTALEFGIGDGYLLNLTAFASTGSPKRGQTYVKAEAIYGRGASATILATLLAGYVTNNQPIAWPGSPIESSIDGDGYVRSVIGTNPAAGAEAAEVVPAGARWELIAFMAELQTDVTAANRRPGLTFDDGGNVYFRSPQPTTIPASTLVRNYWTQGAPFTTAILTTAPVAHLPFGNRLLAGHQIKTLTDLIQVGDDYSTMRYIAREWLDV